MRGVGSWVLGVGFGVWGLGLGFGVWGVGFGAWGVRWGGLGSGCWGPGVGVEGVAFRMRDLDSESRTHHSVQVPTPPRSCPLGTVFNLRTKTSQNCAAVLRRARM